jgi:hypothetical protein
MRQMVGSLSYEMENKCGRHRIFGQLEIINPNLLEELRNDTELLPCQSLSQPSFEM